MGSIVTQAYSCAPGMRLYADSRASARAAMSVSTEMPFSAASACRASIISVSLMASRPSCRRWWSSGHPPALGVEPCRAWGGPPREYGPGPVDVVVGQPLVACSGADGDALVVGRHDLALEAALAVAGGATGERELHLDGLAHGAGEVAGGAQAALEAGAGDLERVGAGDGVGLVEGSGHGAGGVGQHVEVEACRAVDDDLQHRPRDLDVVQVEVALGQEGQHDVTDAIGDGHRGWPPSFHTKGVGTGPTPSLEPLER